MAGDDRWAVPRWLEQAASWGWRLLVVGAAGFVVMSVVVRVRLVLLPVFVALLLATVLIPVRRSLTERGVPTPLAMLATVLVFFGVIAGITFLIVPPIVNEFSDLDAIVDEAVSDVESWLIDGPLGLDAATIEDARERIGQGMKDLASSDGAVLDGVQLVGELFAGLVLTLVVTFFVVKDGERIQAALLRWTPERFRRQMRAAAAASWRALGGYLRASAILGLLEGVIIGVTLQLVGADLAVPMASLTFVAAFFPFVGAIVAGVLATMVAFVTAGTSAAVIVAVVALVVQQFDNDLLAPLIFGKALHLHPLVVVLVLSLGATLGGLMGAFLAVPITAVVVQAVGALERIDVGSEPPAEPPPGSDAVAR